MVLFLGLSKRPFAESNLWNFGTYLTLFVYLLIISEPRGFWV